jgi:hypothetical protein
MSLTEEQYSELLYLIELVRAKIPAPAPVPASGFGVAGFTGPLSDVVETQLATVGPITPTKSGVFRIIATTLATNAEVGPSGEAIKHNYALSIHDTLGGNFFSQNAITVNGNGAIVQGDIQFVTPPNPLGVPITFAVYATTDAGGVPPAGGPMFSVNSQLSVEELP